MPSAEDEAWGRLRAALDRYAGATDPVERRVEDLTRLIVECGFQSFVEVIIIPAGGAANPTCRVRLHDGFRSYVARAAEYWARLAAAHVPPPTVLKP